VFAHDGDLRQPLNVFRVATAGVPRPFSRQVWYFA
jgi:hypothetical protein